VTSPHYSRRTEDSKGRTPPLGNSVFPSELDWSHGYRGWKKGPSKTNHLGRAEAAWSSYFHGDD